MARLKVWQLVITRNENEYKISVQGEHSVIDTITTENLSLAIECLAADYDWFDVPHPLG